MSNQFDGSKQNNHSNSQMVQNSKLRESHGQLKLSIGDQNSSQEEHLRSVQHTDKRAMTIHKGRCGEFVGSGDIISIQKSMGSADETLYQNKNIEKLVGPDPYTTQFDDHIHEKLQNILSHEKIEEVLNIIQQMEEADKAKNHTKKSSEFKIKNQAQIYDELKNDLNLENSLNSKIVTHEHVYNAQRAIIQKHRELFLSGLDDDTQIIHQLNKKYLLTQLMPFNAKLLETRIQLVEIYAWIQRLSRILKKTHTAVFKGISEECDAVDFQSPFERKNLPLIDMDVVHELNIIGKKDYDKVRIFESYESDPESERERQRQIDNPKRYRRRSVDLLRVRSDRASDGNSDKAEFTKTKREQEMDDKIIEQTSLKKTLLKFQNKVMTDNIHGFYFARRLNLEDIVEDHNITKIQNQKDETAKENEQIENDKQVNENNQEIKIPKDKTIETTRTPERKKEQNVWNASIKQFIKIKQPDTPNKIYDNPVEEEPYLHEDMKSPIKPIEVDKKLYQREKMQRLNQKKQKATTLQIIKTDTIFDQYNQSIVNLQKTINQNQVDQAGVNQNFETVLNDFKTKFEIYMQKFAGSTFEDKIVEQFTNQFQKVFDAKLTNYGQNLQNQLDSLKSRFEDEQRDSKKLFTGIQDILRNNHNKFIEHQRDISMINNRIDRIKETQAVFESELKNLSINKLDYNDYHINLEKFEKNQSQFVQQLDQCRVQCTTLDRFVDRYLPVRIQTQLCDTLHNILGQSSRHRLQVYEISAFKKLNNAILCDQTHLEGEETQMAPIDLNISIKETLDTLIQTLKECQAREDAIKLTQAQNNLKNKKQISKSGSDPSNADDHSKSAANNDIQGAVSEAPAAQEFDDGDELFDSDEDDDVQQQKIKAFRENQKKQQAIQSKPKGPSLMELFSQKLKSGLDSKIKELKEEQQELEKQNSTKKMDVALTHMMDQELEKIHDLTEILESQQGRLTKLEMKFPFKQEHILKMMKTFLFMVKGQEERQKFQLEEVQRQFKKLITDNQTQLVDYFNQENQKKIEKVIEFDEKLQQLKQVEQQYQQKFTSLKEQYDNIHKIIQNQLKIDDQKEENKWQFMTEWIKIQNLVDKKFYKIVKKIKQEDGSVLKHDSDTDSTHHKDIINKNEQKVDTNFSSYQSGVNFGSKIEDNLTEENILNLNTCKQDVRDKSLLQNSLNKDSSNFVSSPHNDVVQIPINTIKQSDLFMVTHKGYTIKLKHLIEMRLLLLDKINEANHRYLQNQLIDTRGISARRDIFKDMVAFYNQIKKQNNSIQSVDNDAEEKQGSTLDRFNLSQDDNRTDYFRQQQKQLLVFHDRMDDPTYHIRNNIKTSFQKQRQKKKADSFHSQTSNLFQTFNAENNTQATINHQNLSQSLKQNDKNIIKDIDKSIKRFSNSNIREQSKKIDSSSLDLIAGSNSKAKRNHQSLTKLSTSNKRQTLNLHQSFTQNLKITPISNSLEPLQAIQGKFRQTQQQKLNQTITVHNFQKINKVTGTLQNNQSTFTKPLIHNNLLRAGTMRDFANISQQRKQLNTTQQVIPKKQMNHLVTHSNMRMNTPGIELQQSSLMGKKIGLEARYQSNQQQQQQPLLKPIKTNKVQVFKSLKPTKCLNVATEMQPLPLLPGSTSSDTNNTSRRVPVVKGCVQVTNYQGISQRQFLDSSISQSAQYYNDSTYVEQIQQDETRSKKSNKMLITFGDDNDHNDSEALHGRTFTEMNILQNSLDRDVGGSVLKEKV